ncbi:MAG: sigma-54-dependent transcriptional regulator [Thermoanaerobaculales bacterium]
MLVVDNDAGVRLPLRGFLEAAGLRVFEADSVRSASSTFTAQSPDLVILDYSLPDGNALDLLPKLLSIDADVSVVILTGHGSIDLAVRALQQGAAHFLTKPVDLPTLQVILARLLDQRRTRRHQLAFRSTGADGPPSNPFLGSSPAILRLKELATRFLGASSPILIAGETGVGKGVLARWIHDHGPRAKEPFVHINCAGLTTAFLDAELFGHAKGAFTGAISAKQGLLEVANHGTVFLDEVGDLAPEIQPKLLKVLEDGTFRRLGEVRDRTVDVRLIAATNRELERTVEDGRFRSDLYFRLSTLPLRIPPLRERANDIEELTEVLLDRLALELGRPRVQLSRETHLKLITYPWPGNIRELRNVLERAVLLCDRDLVDKDDLDFGDFPQIARSPGDTSLSLEEVEQRHIAAVLAEENGQVAKAAERLGVPRSTLYKKLNSLDIATPRRRVASAARRK